MRRRLLAGAALAAPVFILVIGCLAQVLVDPLRLPIQPCFGCPDTKEPSQLDMFDNVPDFSVNIPSFDSMNRPYIRDRKEDIHGIPGTLQRMRYGRWDQQEFEPAIKRHFGYPPYICYTHAGGWYNAQIVFDSDDVAYTVVHARPSSEPCGLNPVGHFALLMLYSVPVQNSGGMRGFGEDNTWDVLELKPLDKTEVRFALERPHSPEPLEGPPAVLLWSPTGHASPCTNYRYGTLKLIKPVRDAQGISLAAPAVISSEALHIDSHAGGGTQALARNGKIYAAWNKARLFDDESLPDRCGILRPDCSLDDNKDNPLCKDSEFDGRCRLGSRTTVVEYAVVADNPPHGQWRWKLQPGPGTQVNVSCPTNDGHNRPALVMDTAGYLHLMIGSHGCPFRYSKTTWADNISQWHDVSPTDGLNKHCAGDFGGIRQTYAAFVRDRHDRLHLVYRRHGSTNYPNAADKTGNGYFLEYQYKNPGAGWSKPLRLVNPHGITSPRSEIPPTSRHEHHLYNNYFHQITIDRYGHLYLLISYFSRVGDLPQPPAWFPEATEYKYSHLLVSEKIGHDWNGPRWEYASTLRFDEYTRWQPWTWQSAVGVTGEGTAGMAADVDGDGLDDVVHVFWDHGFSVHIDRSVQSDASWTGWSTRVSRFTDGPLALQFPPLLGRVNADSRADLVFVFRHWESGQVVLRTHFSQTDGHFSGVSSVQPDGYYPDPQYPIAPLMGDVASASGTPDGLDDIILMYRTACGLNIRTKRSLGDGTWATTTDCHPDGAKVHTQYPPRIGDMNGDGLKDLVFMFREIPAGSTSSVLKIRVKTSNGNGTWTAASEQTFTDGTMIHQYPHLLGDVDGDGRDDLVFLFRQDGQFKIRVKLANAGGFGVSTETVHPDGSQIPHYRPMIARVNSDPCADLIFPHRANDGVYRLRTFFASCDRSQHPQWQRVTTELP